MPKGIEILNAYEVTNEAWASDMFAGVCLAIIATLSLLISITYGSSLKANFCEFCITVVLFVIMLPSCIYTFRNLPENKYQTRYEVIISDDVNFNEFSSKYEVVKQEGLIYTIIEKTNKG